MTDIIPIISIIEIICGFVWIASLISLLAWDVGYRILCIVSVTLIILFALEIVFLFVMSASMHQLKIAGIVVAAILIVLRGCYGMGKFLDDGDGLTADMQRRGEFD